MLSFEGGGHVIPIYEYECRDCRTDFELLVRASAAPFCESTSLQKRLSAFAVGRGGPAAAASVPQACGSCGDPRGSGACSMN